MSLIKVRVKRPDAAHHTGGQVYKTGDVFEMEESDFLSTIPGFFERADLEQIKSKELPIQVHEPSAATPKVQELIDPKPEKKLKLTKR